MDTNPDPAPPPPTTRSGRHVRARRANEATTANTYVAICISIYDRDLAALDAKVAELKRRGRIDMNRSKLIRLAVEALDLDRVPTRL